VQDRKGVAGIDDGKFLLLNIMGRVRWCLWSARLKPPPQAIKKQKEAAQ
jgi:hypothetical protein